MLTYISLENFQSHKHTVIDGLSSGINCIIGESQTGKSAIYRALYWLYFNDYSGRADNFIRKGASRCSVKVGLDSGHTIERVKGASVNDYIVTYPDGTEQRFTNVAASVPDVVIELLQIGNYVAPGDKKIAPINFSQQGEPSFLLYESGPNRARMLNTFTGVDKLDLCVRELITSSRDYGRQARATTEELSALEEDIANYDYLTEMESALSKARLSISAAEDAQKRCKRLIDGKNRILQERDRITKADAALNRLNSLPARDIDLGVITELFNKLQHLREQKGRIVTLKTAGKTAVDRLKSLPDTRPSTEQVTGILQTYKRLCSLRTAQTQAEEELKNLQEAANNVDVRITTIRQNYTDILVDIGSCPTCGSPIDTGRVQEHMHA